MFIYKNYTFQASKHSFSYQKLPKILIFLSKIAKIFLFYINNRQNLSFSHQIPHFPIKNPQTNPFSHQKTSFSYQKHHISYQNTPQNTHFPIKTAPKTRHPTPQFPHFCSHFRNFRAKNSRKRVFRAPIFRRFCTIIRRIPCF
jgi:hypothetical protein